MKPNEKDGQRCHLDDLLDSDEACCHWEAVAKRQEKKIKQLESDLAMLQETMNKEVQFVSEITKKAKVIHTNSQTDEQTELILKRTSKSIKFSNDDGYDSDNLKRARINPTSDYAFEEFLKENNVTVNPEFPKHPDLEPDIVTSAANLTAGPIETQERTIPLENKQQESENASSSLTDADDAKAKELKPTDKVLLSKLFVYSTGDSEATKPIPIANSDKQKCWLNVILQTFLFTRPMCGFLKTWRDVFQGRISKLKDGDNFSPPISAFRNKNMKFTVKLMNCAHQLTRLSSEESEDYFDPKTFKTILFKLKPSFKHNYQDASEGLNEILKLFQEELFKSHQLLSLEGVKVNAIPLQEGFTVVTQHACSYWNGTRQETPARKQNWENPLIRLQVPNNIDNETSVLELMSKKFKTSDEIKLSDGRKRIETEKIKKLPDCLIIELNKDVTGAKSARGNKGEVYVDPTFTVDPDWCVKPKDGENVSTRIEYALRHFICYIDEHYYALTRRGGGNYETTWWKTSDHIIDEIDEEDVLTKGHCQKATILFYEKL